MCENKPPCFIIGSGIAGLASAVRLAVLGFDVSVFEKNGTPGGKLSLIQKNGYSFDAGPSLFTEPQNIEDIFAFASENINEFFSYKPVPVACKYFFDDGKIINAYCNKEKFAEELEIKTGEARQRVLQYLNSASELYNTAGHIFLNYSLHKISTLIKAPVIKALRAFSPKYIFSTLNKHNTALFEKKETVQIFNRYATYNGSNPYKAPAMLSIIPHVEYGEGVFYPDGGMISITNALYRLALKKGVKFYFNTPVESVIVKDNCVQGIVVNGENKMCDTVVSNADVYFTCKKLLQDDGMADKILQNERSSSAIIFYWGIKKSFPQLELHNIFFSNNYPAEFEYIFQKKKLFTDPTVYINITAKCEPGLHAPEGKENWFVMVNAPALSLNAVNNEMTDQCRNSIIHKLSTVLKTDIRPLIETEEILHPNLIETRTGSYMGSLYGTSSNSRLAAFLRHPNFSKKNKGLYFAGGSVHPGGGIPLCMKSAKIMCDIIKTDLQKKQGRHAH